MISAEMVGSATARKNTSAKKRHEIHTNTIEGFYSIFRRGMKDMYQHYGKPHLYRCAAEFDFRYNHREANEISDAQKAPVALSSIVGKRILYRNWLGE